MALQCFTNQDTSYFSDPTGEPDGPGGLYWPLPSPGVRVPWPASRAGLRFRRGGQAEPRADPRRGFGLGGLEGLADAGEGGIDIYQNI